MTEYYTIFNSLPFSMTLLPYAKLGDYHNASSGLCTTYNIYYSIVRKTTLHLYLVFIQCFSFILPNDSTYTDKFKCTLSAIQ